MTQKKILFATVPVDGHFNPLTELAVHLKSKGHEIAWYAGKGVEKKLEKLGINRFPFEKAKEINQFNIDEFFPERTKIPAGVKRLKFDLKNFFVYRAPEYFEDIRRIREHFEFDMMVCDTAFTAGELVKKKLNVPVVGIGIVPLSQSSRDLAPYGVGLAPTTSFFGKTKQRFLRYMAKNVLFKEASVEYNKILDAHGLPPNNNILFDVPITVCDVVLQSGVPGFEYKRSDISPVVKFVGSMRSYKYPDRTPADIPWLSKLRGKKVILVSQGTFEPDHSKLIHPVLEAFKHSDYIILVATGYHHTQSLRTKYQQENIIIEDFMDFDRVMPLCDVYISNGGYGGTLLSIEHDLPMVCAGVNEGKNEICTRIGYFKIGIDLQTENATPEALKAATEKIISDKSYKENVVRLRQEFDSYKTLELCEKYVTELLNQHR